MKNTPCTLVTFVLTQLAVAGCGASAPTRPPVAPYSPSFDYAVKEAGEKADVTVGIVGPQFSGDGEGYWQTQKSDAVVSAAVRALRTSFAALLSAKGFNAAGPFDSVDEMTFPEKKTSDFILYPELDIVAQVQRSDVTVGQDGNAITGYEQTLSCKAKMSLSGTVLLTVKEPLSGEKMWVKRVEVSEPEQSFELRDAQCQSDDLGIEVKNAWAHLHENMYRNVMASLDRYVTADEFAVLKSQSADLRSRKVY